MLDDLLERDDIERAVLKGRIERKLTAAQRGTRYRVAGPAMDGRTVSVIVRFREDADLVIVAVYALENQT